MILNREQILAQRLPTEKISIPWIAGAEINVRALPTPVVARSQETKEGFDSDAYVFVNAAVDEKGERLYADTEVAMVGETVDRALIEIVCAAAFRLSIVSEEKRAAIKKNWPTRAGAQSGESPSASDIHTQT